MEALKSQLVILVLVVFTAGIISNVYAETVVDAAIATDTTWDSAGSPYIIGSDLFIGNAVLTIDPGVIVEFSADYGITIGNSASIQALGQEGAEIVFRLSSAASTTSWDQITFNPGATVTTFNPDESFASGSIFKYTSFSDSNPANNTGVILAHFIAPYFDNVRFINNQQGAIFADRQNGVFSISNSTFRQNNLLDASINAVIEINGAASVVIKDSTVVDNGSANSMAKAVISCLNCAGIKLIDNEITDNYSWNYGALNINTLAGTQVNNLISGNLFRNNITLNPSGLAGAIDIAKANVSISNNRVDQNESNGNAGAIALNGSTALIKNNIISNNTAVISSGAAHVYNPVGNIDIVENIFINNVAQNGHGAGIHVHNFNSAQRSNIVNIQQNLFVRNHVGQLTQGNNRQIDEGDCIYISETDASIKRNVFTGQGFVNCIYLANHINGGVTDNVFYNISNTESFIRLFNDSTTYLSAETSPIYNNNFFSNIMTTRYIDRRLASQPNLIDTNNNWWDGVNPVSVTPLNTDTSNANPSPNTTPPLSAPANVIAEQNNGTINISWDANPEPDVAGYNIYWMVDGQGFDYTNMVDAGLVTQYSLTLGDTGIYTVAVTAYKTSYDSTADVPETYINDNQTTGTESWYSVQQELTGVTNKSSATSSGSGGGSMNIWLIWTLLIGVFICRRNHVILNQ